MAQSSTPHSSRMPASDRPGLFLSPEQWQRLPEKLDDPFFQRIAEANLEMIDLFRRKEHPMHQGPGQKMMVTPLHLSARIAKARLERGAVAWWLTRDEQYLDFCRETVDWLVEPDRIANHELANGLHHMDLTGGELTYDMVFALDTLAEHLGGDRTETLITRLIEDSLPTYLRGYDDRDWWWHADFNWGTCLHGNAGLAAMAIEKWEPELASRVMDRVRDGLSFVVANFPAGGGWTEGLMYLSTTLGHLTDLLNAMQRTRGTTWGFGDEADIMATFDFRPHMVGGDDCVINFSNCNDGSTQFCLPQAYWWAQRHGRPDWAGFEDAHPKPPTGAGLFHDVETFWFREPHQASEPFECIRLAHFKGLDWFKWSGDHAWLGLRSGYNAGNHNNRDLGQIVFGVGGERFLIDPGYGHGQTNQHNCPTIGDQQQAHGATARIFRIDDLGDGFYLACDLTQVFEHWVDRYWRHVLLIEDRHLVVIDEMLGRRGHRPRPYYHLQSRIEPQMQDGGFALAGETTSMHIRYLLPAYQPRVSEWEGRRVGSGYTVTWQEDPQEPRAVMGFLASERPEAVTVAFEGDRAVAECSGRVYQIDRNYGCLFEPWLARARS